MPSTYHHGVRVIELTSGLRPVRAISTAIIGLVCTAPGADAAYFPLNTPVLVTNVGEAIGKAGATGTLVRSLQAIADQTNPVIVVVRVEAGANEAATTTNVIGSTVNGQYTGIQALLGAQARIGARPRILAAPGLDTQEVAAALVAVAKKLRAMAYVSAIGVDKAAAALYRDSFGDREVMLVWPDFKSWNTETNQLDTSFATARAVGLRAKIDEEIGWHKTLSNLPVAGVSGVTKDVQWDLQDPDSDAGFLNSNDITTIIHSNGYRFWGSRTCSDDPLFAFESAARAAHVLADTMAEGVFWGVDKPMSASLARDILETIKAKGRSMTAEGYLLGFDAWIDESVNTVDNLKQGKLAIDYDYTPVPPLEDLSLRQRITDRYYANFAARAQG